MSDDPSPTSPIATPPANEPPSPAPVLAYQSPRSGKGVTVAWCADAMEAELLCNELQANGVPAVTANEHIVSALQGYVGFVRVEVQVAVEDRDRAAAVLARLPGRNDVEPADEPADGSADFTTDDSGARLPLAVVAEYDTAQEMLEASAALGSARVQTFLPDLMPKRPRPAPGQGPTPGDADDADRPPPRFRVRVLEEELPRAQRVLQESDGDEDSGDEDDPRCPKCASWRVHGATPGVVSSIVRLFTGGGRSRGKTWQCLRCKFKWADDVS
jgi:hypothetical protein